MVIIPTLHKPVRYNFAVGFSVWKSWQPDVKFIPQVLAFPDMIVNDPVVVSAVLLLLALLR